jgi:hypothetical protein
MLMQNCPVDPWFNFRATKYLVQNGFYDFWDWFDDRTLLFPVRASIRPTNANWDILH